MNQELIDDLKHLVNKISDKKILEFQECLLKKTIRKKSDSYELKKKLKLNPDETNTVKKILKSANSIETIIIGLDLIHEINKKQNEIKNNTSLIWTSPSIIHENADNTKSTILRLISSAKKSITIVGYVMNSGAKSILASLTNVAEKHPIKIKIIFDRADKAPEGRRRAKSPKEIIEKLWPAILQKPEIYKYAKHSNETVLHAKVIIVDSKKILVTSANLTGRAIHGNLEIGILHTGNVAWKAENLISDLIANKTLVQVNG